MLRRDSQSTLQTSGELSAGAKRSFGTGVIAFMQGPIDRPSGDDCPVISKSPIECLLPLEIRKGCRLQFVAFDASYLERLQQRDAATERHFEAYFGELLRLKLRSKLSSHQAIDDVRQETFVRVFALVRQADGVKHADRLGALVNGVCGLVLREHYRASGAQRRSHAALEDVPESDLVADGVSLNQSLESEQAQALVRKTLQGLQPRDRRLLEAVLLEERDKDEVCSELGVTRGHLRVLVHRAKQSFKEYYCRHFAQGEGAPK
jgi:RNA polymerase sigma-70 factor (ECF subfamily)